MSGRCRLYLVVTEELSRDIHSYLDKLLDLICVDETHEWMKENPHFDSMRDLYEEIDRVEAVIPWADPGTPLTTDTRKQLFDLLDSYDERFGD